MVMPLLNVSSTMKQINIQDILPNPHSDQGNLVNLLPKIAFPKRCLHSQSLPNTYTFSYANRQFIVDSIRGINFFILYLFLHLSYGYCVDLPSIYEDDSNSKNSTIIRFGNKPCGKTNNTKRMQTIKRFSLTGFVAGQCEKPYNQGEWIFLPIGNQVFAAKICNHTAKICNDTAKSLTFISQENSANSIRVDHCYLTYIWPYKMTLALWSFFGERELLETNDPTVTEYSFDGDYVFSASTDLSSVITSVLASAEAKPNFYGVSIFRNKDQIVYQLIDGILSWEKEFLCGIDENTGIKAKHPYNRLQRIDGTSSSIHYQAELLILTVG